MVQSARERAKARHEMSTVVLGIMVVGLGAFVGYVGIDYQNGDAMFRQAAFATWLVIMCGALGIGWVLASMLFSMGAQAGHDIKQPLAYEDFGRDGAVDTKMLDGLHMVRDEEYYKELAKSCILAMRSRETEASRIRAGTARSQAALFVGLAVMGIGAMAALASLGGLLV